MQVVTKKIRKNAIFAPITSTISHFTNFKFSETDGILQTTHGTMKVQRQLNLTMYVKLTCYQCVLLMPLFIQIFSGIERPF